MAKAELDQSFMAAALRLARRGLGRAWPNPSVGALVVDTQSCVIGGGWTADGGRPHAEVIALDEAGTGAKGATLYVTLEPCAHHGQTPPCAEAIVSAGIGRVVCACDDPDVRVAGKGFQILRDAGISVKTGVLAEEGRRVNAGHIARATLNRPYVYLKLAVSKDGRIAGAGGEQIAITGDITNRWVHRMRAQADAILVGIGTVEADDPSLTCRLPGAEHYSPHRVVVDTHLRLDPASQLVKTAVQTPVWVFASKGACDERRLALEARHVRIFNAEEDQEGCLDLTDVLETLAEEGVTRLMVEGGAHIARSLVSRDFVDEVMLIEGEISIRDEGLRAFVDQGPELIAASEKYILSEKVVLGNDVATVYRSQLN